MKLIEVLNNVLSNIQKVLPFLKKSARLWISLTDVEHGYVNPFFELKGL